MLDSLFNKVAGLKAPWVAASKNLSNAHLALLGKDRYQDQHLHVLCGIDQEYPFLSVVLF